MSAPRAVRIARGGTGSATTPAVERSVLNRGGTARAWRLFVLFTGVLLAIYAVFAGLMLASPTPGVRTNDLAWAAFTAVALLLVLWGWTITLGLAPRAVSWKGDELVVRERLGSLRHLRRDRPEEMVVRRRYAVGFVSPEPTVLIEVRSREGRKRTYLIGADLLRSVAPDLE